MQRQKTPGHYGDGGGLWLQVGPTGTKSWVFRYTRAAKTREMGLGALHTISLAEARVRARGARQSLLDGIDPMQARDALQLTARAAAAKALTFRAAAGQYIELNRAGWKNPKHVDQWTNTLEAYAFPVFGDLLVSAIDSGLVVKALTRDDLWTTKTETASRVRGRIESVLDWATVQGHRTGENPARWRGMLEHSLPAPTKVAKVRNHPAIDRAELGAFIARLRVEPGIAARALELIILTASRTSEVIAAQWSEFDLDAALWTIPAERMKAQREHRSPLAPAAVAVLRKMSEVAAGPFVFPGRKPDTALSNMACLKLLERMGRTDITVHGFRSTFKDWAAEETDYPGEVSEAALAHTIGDATERAYRRGDLLLKRAALMKDWADYCATVRAPAVVRSIKKGATTAGKP